jgi:hypothetical protein
MRTDGQKTDRQTDMTKLIVAFRNFANAPKFPKRLTPNYVSIFFGFPLFPPPLIKYHGDSYEFPIRYLR